MTIQEKAIEQIERISHHLSAIGEKEDYTDIAIQALEQTRWIPVSEEPKEQGSYITTIKYGDKYAVGQRYYHGKYVGWEDSCVIAWMPLPQPYKAESEKR